MNNQNPAGCANTGSPCAYEAGRKAERAEIIKALELHQETTKRRLLIMRAAGITEALQIVKAR